MTRFLQLSKLPAFYFFLFSISLHAQSDTLINPNKEGGFELGNGSFAANGWSVATNNATQVNQWTSGRGAQQGFIGTNCAYITDQPNVSPPPHHYTPQQGSTVHFYRDVTFPAGKTLVNMFFMYLKTVPNAPIRVALVHRDSALTTGITLGLININNSSYSFWGYNFDPSVIGNCDRDTTWRLVFTWADPSSGINYQPPPAIDFIQMTASAVLPAFSGTDSLFTIDKTRETSGSNFKSFKDAINALNTNVSGLCNRDKPLIFNVMAGQVFTETGLKMTASGTALMPIIFRKNGSGANPVIRPKPIDSYTQDGFTISGSDYLTIDGIDIDGRTDSAWYAYSGYRVETSGSTNGAQNNTIKNCTITLDSRAKLAYNSTGILQTTGNNSVTSSEGANSRNRFLNVNIYNCYKGIVIKSRSNYPDSLIEIGSTDPRVYSEIGTPLGNDIENTAIYTEGVSALSIHHLNSSMPLIITSASGDTRIYNNKVITKRGHTALFLSTEIFSPITNSSLEVFNNFFSMPRSKNRLIASNYEISAVKVRISNTQGALKFYNNSIYIDESFSSISVPYTACLIFEANSKTTFLNNIFANVTLPTTSKPQFCVVGRLIEGATSNYNAYWRAYPLVKIGGQQSGTFFPNLTDWQTAELTPQDTNSIETNPLFLSENDLHAYGLGIDGKGTTPPNGLLVDIDNEPRTAPFDIGADQFMRQTIDLSVVDLIEPNDTGFVLCENVSRKTKVKIKNLGAQMVNFALNPSVIKVVVTKPVGKDSFTTTLSTGTLAVDSTQIVELNAVAPSNYGSYFFQTSVSTVGDANRQNDSSTFERKLIAPKPLPFNEFFENYQSVYADWTLSSTVSTQYRGKTGYSLSLSIPSVGVPSPEFRVPKVAKIDTSTLLSFDYRVIKPTYPVNELVPNSPNWGKIEILGSIDCGATFTTIRTIDTTNHRPSVDYQSVQLPLSMFAGKELVLKFVITSPLVNQIYVDFDNFYIGSPCRGLVGMDTLETPLLACVGSFTSLFAKLASPNLFGTKWQWQYSIDSARTWVNTASYTNTNPIYPVYAKAFPVFYRMKTICATDSSSRLSNQVLVKPTNLSSVAQVPYRESFENWQSSACIQSFASNDIPSTAWYDSDTYGNSSWRRNDEGHKANWTTYNATGNYSPNSTSGQYSARYHSSSNPANNNQFFDLFIDLSGTADKQIAFDFINADGNDKMQISLSTDAGFTFVPLDTPLSIATTWRRFKYNIPSNGSSKSVLRFTPIGSTSTNNSDIGIDSLTIENITTAPSCIALTTPQNGTTNAQDDQLFTWQSADYATGYRIKIGTTANGSDVLSLTDIGVAKQYRYPNFFDYQKTYYVTLEPYNNFGAAQGCPITTFTIGKNPNFGGGRDGLDTLQPLSGGYTFANSTTFAANAPNGKGVYNWVSVNDSEIKSFANAAPTNGYLYLNSLFRFPFYSGNTSGNTLLIGSNGIIGFNGSVSDYNPNKTIPSTTDPNYGIIAPCYTSLYRGANSKMYIKSDSTQFVATWWHFYASNAGVQDTSEYITFQVILKPDGSIKMQYNAEESSVGRLANSKIQQTSLIGIEGQATDYSGQRGIQYRNKGRGVRIFDAQNKSLAIDFQAPKGDLAIYSLTTPNESSRCLSDVYPSIYVHNKSVGTMDFARTPATLTLKLTGVRNKTLIYKIDTGTLSFNANMEVRFPTPLSMDTAGVYNFEITIKNELDENPLNDIVRTIRTIEGSSVSLPFLEDFNTITQVSGGNGGGFYQTLSDWSIATYQSSAMRLRKGDYLAFDYRLLTYINYQPQTALLTSDWDKIQIGYTTSCGYDFKVLDSITPTSHSSTIYWRQKSVRIPDSLEGKLVKIQVQFFKKGSNMVMDIDNFYVGRACDSTQIDIGNITAPPSVCQGDVVRAGVFQRPIAPFMQYNWQYSTNNGTSWVDLTAVEGNNYIMSKASLTATYRVIGTCTLNQMSDTTNSKLISAFIPDFALLPYTQSFENWQTSSCNNTSYTNDVPDAYWLNLSQGTSSPWRRNNQGNLGGWSNTSGAYTPTSSQGSYSARFNSTVPYPPVQGSLNLFVNLSGTTDKTLAFDYLNKNGSDSLRVSWSTDGGATFTPLSNLNLASSWTQYSYSLIGGTAQSVIRFEGVNLYEQYGRDDIGLDNVRVFANNFTNDAAISAISPLNFGCQNAVQPLTVKLRNAGIEAINLATTPITVNISVSGALSRSFTKTVNTGNLAVGELLDVVLEPNFTLSAIGIHNIDANLVSTADSNAVNNTLKTQVRVVSETTIPFAETFDASPNFPIGWVTEGGVRMDTSWRNNGNFRLGFYMASYFDPNLSTKGGSFTMPKIGVVRANDYLSFDALINRYNQPLPSGVDWGSVEAVLSDDCGQTWTTVWTANSSNFNSSLNASNIRIPLSNYVGKSIIVRFTAAYKSDSYFIWFDNFKVNTKCIGAPTISAITGSSSICYGEKATLQTAVGSGIGLNWVWQKQDTTAWTVVDTNKTQITTPALFSVANYRIVATCLIDSITATSAPFSISVNQPTYAQLPYYQDFETWQSCNGGTNRALPDASWVQQTYTGNGSWRRNDNGTNATWTNPTWGEYTPLSTKGNFSARFHGSQSTYNTPYSLDLYVDLSQTRGVKYLSFDYINASMANSITIYLSKDGGKTFDYIERIGQTLSGWERFEKAIYSDSARSILRFSASGYPFSSNPADVGLDNLVISNNAMPNCVEWLSPTSYASNVPSDAVLKWRNSVGAKGYKIKIGTTQYGSEFLPLTDIARDTFYKPTQKFAFLTTYFVSVFAYDSLGNARTSCYSTQFGTQRNPNFGGGPNGNDPGQPMSGGYFFANSTPAASMALPSQPRYAWIDPLSNNHATITNWTSGNSNNGSFTLPNIGFDFSYFGTIYSNNIYVNSNGALHFGTPNTSTGTNEYIPNSSAPNNFLAACWMDLAAGSDGKVYYGTSANGEYVITWWHYHDVEPNGTTIDTAEYITFQAILNPNGTIKVQYNDSESTANNGRVFDILTDALIGIEDASGTMGIQYRNNGGLAPMFSSPLAIAFALNNKLLPLQNSLNTEGVSVSDVFPNPSTNQWSFDFYTPQKMVLTIQLSNPLGQVVWTDKTKSQIGWQQKTVEWNNLPVGIYWLTVATEQGQRFVQRVIRQ